MGWPNDGKRMCRKCRSRLPLAEFSRTKILRGDVKCDTCRDGIAAWRADIAYRKANPPPPAFRRWTAEEDAMLAKAVRRKMTAREAAAFCGRTQDAAYSRRAILKLPPLRRPGQEKGWGPRRIDRLRAAIAVEGLSYTQAAIRFRVSRSAISGAITRHLPELRHRRLRPCALTGKTRAASSARQSSPERDSAPAASPS